MFRVKDIMLAPRIDLHGILVNKCTIQYSAASFCSANCRHSPPGTYRKALRGQLYSLVMSFFGCKFPPVSNSLALIRPTRALGPGWNGPSLFLAFRSYTVGTVSLIVLSGDVLLDEGAMWP
jgi:hypothetical protein